MTSERQLSYYVYLLASRRHGTLYLGITRNLVCRPRTAASTNISRVSCQVAAPDTKWTALSGSRRMIDAVNAISREKELKKRRRDWKIRPIEEQNPQWRDLYPPMLR